MDLGSPRPRHVSPFFRWPCFILSAEENCGHDYTTFLSSASFLPVSISERLAGSPDSEPVVRGTGGLEWAAVSYVRVRL